jgi:hypothetical protein
MRELVLATTLQSSGHERCSILTIIAGRKAVKTQMANYSSLDFDCPVCGAFSKERCINLAGSFRFESHVERKWIAQDQRPERSPSTAIPAGSRVIEYKQAP